MFEPACVEPALRRASHRLRLARALARGSLALAGAIASASGCVQAPLPCPIALEEGDVVITEIRGPQEGRDTRGEWFELHNATDERIDLRGLRGTLRPLEGSAVDGELALAFLVRQSLPVEPGGYVVLGTLPLDEPKRPELDYSVNLDFVSQPPPTVEYETPNGDVIEVPPPAGGSLDPRALFQNARMELWACERRLDAFAYVSLPGCGTLAYDGREPPDADDNDDPARWCTDAEASQWCTDDADPTLPTPWGAPGSGGEANRPCP